MEVSPRLSDTLVIRPGSRAQESVAAGERGGGRGVVTAGLQEEVEKILRK